MKLVTPKIELSKEIVNLRIALWEFEKNSADFKIKIPELDTISKEMGEYYNNKDRRIFGLEEGGNLIGFIYGNIEESAEYIEEYNKTGYIEGIYIEEVYRGKGGGKLLIDSMLDWFHEEGINLVQLGVLTNNIEALEVYKKYGFQSYYTKMKMVI